MVCRWKGSIHGHALYKNECKIHNKHILKNATLATKTGHILGTFVCAVIGALIGGRDINGTWKRVLERKK